MNKLKESILNDAKKSGGDTINASNETTGPTSNASNETTSATNTTATTATSTNNTNTTTRSNDTYIYGVGTLAILAIGVCIFFAYNTFTKKQANDRLVAQHDPAGATKLQQKRDQPPKRGHML